MPLLFADPLEVIKISRLMISNSNLQLPPQIFYFRLARPLQDLHVLLLEPLLCCLGRVFWVIVMLKYPSMTHYQCPGPIHSPFDVVQLSCPLSRKTFPKHNISTSMFDVGMVFLGSQAAFLLPQTRRVELMPKSWMLVSSDHNTFTQFSSE